MGSSGRKKGSVTLRTREVAERAAGEGVTPLEIMLSVMHEQWQAYRQDKTPQSCRSRVGRS